MNEHNCVIEDNTIKLSGKLNFQSVPDIQRQLLNQFSQKRKWIIDLAEISFSDSAGLALLADCKREAALKGFDVQFKAMPPQMLAMAKVTGIERILNNE